MAKWAPALCPPTDNLFQGQRIAKNCTRGKLKNRQGTRGS